MPAIKTFAAGVAVSAAALLAPLAHAAEAVLFSGLDYSGERRAINDEERDLNHLRFNDRAKSIRIKSGTWEVCTDGRFRGRCEVLTHDMRSLYDIGMGTTISSLRPVRDRGHHATGPRHGRHGDDRYYGHREPRAIEFFYGRHYHGDSRVFARAVGNLSAFLFNDRAQSVRIHRGSWQICEHDDFGGTCIIADRDIANLAHYGLAGEVTSFRPLSDVKRHGKGLVQLYGRPGFEGRQTSVNRSRSSLRYLGFNDDAYSLRVFGGKWLACEHADYKGRCVIVERNVRNLSRFGLGGEISSLKRVRKGHHGDEFYFPRYNAYNHHYHGGYDYHYHHDIWDDYAHRRVHDRYAYKFDKYRHDYKHKKHKKHHDHGRKHRHDHKSHDKRHHDHDTIRDHRHDHAERREREERREARDRREREEERAERRREEAERERREERREARDRRQQAEERAERARDEARRERRQAAREQEVRERERANEQRRREAEREERSAERERRRQERVEERAERQRERIERMAEAQSRLAERQHRID